MKSNAMEQSKDSMDVDVTKPSLPPPPTPENHPVGENSLHKSLPQTQTLNHDSTSDGSACQSCERDEKSEVQLQEETQSVAKTELITLQLRDEISGAQARVMREIPQVANDYLAAVATPPTLHRKTGQVRMPRDILESEYCSSADEDYLAVESAEDVFFPAFESQTCPSTLGCGQKRPRGKEPAVQKSRKTPRTPKPKGSWVRSSIGDYAINPVKCPPCARKKQKDKCHGGLPCKECYSKGRMTVESCQEWGEGWKPEERRAKIVLPKPDFVTEGVALLESDL